MLDCDIRLALPDDVENIMKFIDHNWQKNHILACDIDMFSWQYSFGSKLSMVLGIDSEGKIQGLLGYIAYEAEIGQKPDLCLALWKANTGQGILGMRLLLFIKERVPHRHIFCVGINIKTTQRIYEDFGFSVGKMNQWYRLHIQDEYKIASVCNLHIPTISKKQLHIDYVSNPTDIKKYVKQSEDERPYKSLKYLEKRYFNHPKYKYELYLANGGLDNSLLMVIRKQEAQNSCVLRLVDLVGDLSLFPYCTAAIDVLLQANDAEYIDCYELGVPRHYMLEAGYIPVEGSNNIIPNYFNPYLKENVSIYCAIDEEGFVIFRGDGDQDRPN